MIPYFGASVTTIRQSMRAARLSRNIKNVKTPTLILVGERDGECPLPQSYEYWHALKTLGVENEFVVYANEGHRISKPENAATLCAARLHGSTASEVKHKVIRTCYIGASLSQWTGGNAVLPCESA